MAIESRGSHNQKGIYVSDIFVGGIVHRQGTGIFSLPVEEMQ